MSRRSRPASSTADDAVPVSSREGRSPGRSRESCARSPRRLRPSRSIPRTCPRVPRASHAGARHPRRRRRSARRPGARVARRSQALDRGDGPFDAADGRALAFGLRHEMEAAIGEERVGVDMRGGHEVRGVADDEDRGRGTPAARAMSRIEPPRPHRRRDRAAGPPGRRAPPGVAGHGASRRERRRRRRRIRSRTTRRRRLGPREPALRTKQGAALRRPSVSSPRAPTSASESRREIEQRPRGVGQADVPSRRSDAGAATCCGTSGRAPRTARVPPAPRRRAAVMRRARRGIDSWRALRGGPPHANSARFLRSKDTPRPGKVVPLRRRPLSKMRRNSARPSVTSRPRPTPRPPDKGARRCRSGRVAR